MTMNKTIIFLFLSLLFSQIKENEGLLEMIKNNSLQLENQKDDPIEKIYIQAKSLERAALYDEALTLYKQINNVQPGNRKYFKSLKKYLKEIEAWDTLFVYTNAFSKARNNDFQSKLELIFEKEKPDVVVNLAAQAGVRYSIKEPHTYLDNNLSATVNLLEVSKENNITDFIFSSTSFINLDKSTLNFLLMPITVSAFL